MCCQCVLSFTDINSPLGNLHIDELVNALACNKYIDGDKREMKEEDQRNTTGMLTKGSVF